jgi:23S rRNA (guanosine2251-2'-O)-methyltransferase
VEWLAAVPTQVLVVYCDASAPNQTGAARAHAAAVGIPVQLCPAETLAKLSNTSRHQGVVAECKPFPYVGLDAVLAKEPRLLVLADQLQDPHNLGALIRTAEAVGAGGLLIPRDGSASVTAAVESAAAGAAALLPVCRVTNVGRALAQCKKAGYWTVGLAPRVGRNLFKFDPPTRVVIVLGGETGIRPLVERQCDFLVSIPMAGRIESLNASVAAAVVLYEMRRRWG